MSTHFRTGPLKLFDVLGRLALEGIWTYLLMSGMKQDAQIADELEQRVVTIADAIKHLIVNNPVLFLPIKDDQAIDISLAALLLIAGPENQADMVNWLTEMVNRADFSYQVNGKYPCNLNSYDDLLDHPEEGQSDYYREVTAGSILFPTIALLSALLKNNELYSEVQAIKEKHLDHCNFQLWYPDDSSEEHIYLNSDGHGGTFSHVGIERSMNEYLEQVFGECKHSPQFDSLSAVKEGLWPIVLVACRHHRLPIPVHLWKGFYSE